MLARRFSGASAAVLLSFALHASGEAEMEPVRIEYHGAAGCPSARQVILDILGRTRRARPAQPGEAARSFRLSAHSVKGRSIGRLEIVARDGASTVREVGGGSCTEVLEALTLIARIAIDPEQALESDASNSAPKPVPGQPSRTGRVGKGRGSEQRLPPSDQANQHSGTMRDTTVGAREPGAPSRFHAGVGGQVFVSSLISPGLTPGASIFGELTGDPPSWFGLRGGVRLAVAGETDTAAGTARFTLIAGRLNACLPRVPLSARWTLCPGVALEAGTLSARGSETLAARSATRPWLAAGIGLGLKVRILPTLFAEVEIEGSAPLVRDRFVFDQPATTAHETPAFGANLGVGLGYQLW